MLFFQILLLAGYLSLMSEETIWKPVLPDPRAPLWTDDQSNPLAVLKHN